MASAIMSKVWNLFGMDQADPEDIDNEEDDVYDYDYEEEEQPVEEKKSFIKRNNSKVVSMEYGRELYLIKFISILPFSISIFFTIEKY